MTIIEFTGIPLIGILDMVQVSKING